MTRSRLSKKNVAMGALLATAALIPFSVSAFAAEPGKETNPSPEETARLTLPVASINGETLTLEYVEQTASKQSPLLRKELTNAEKRKEFVDKLPEEEIDFYCLNCDNEFTDSYILKLSLWDVNS